MQTVFSEALLAGLRTRNVAEKEEGRDDIFQDPDDVIDPDDSGPRLVVIVAEPTVEKIYTLPPPPSEMPANWWEALLFGKPGDAVSPQNARLALMLVEARLGEHQDSGESIKRDPGANVEAVSSFPTTVGELHDRIYELYDSRGWRVFQQLYHEAAGLQPKRHKMIAATNVIPNSDAATGPPDLLSSEVLRSLPLQVARFFLHEPRDLPRWQTSAPPEGMDDGVWTG
jgi:hypothetical protein